MSGNINVCLLFVCFSLYISSVYSSTSGSQSLEVCNEQDRNSVMVNGKTGTIVNVRTDQLPIIQYTIPESAKYFILTFNPKFIDPTDPTNLLEIMVDFSWNYEKEFTSIARQSIKTPIKVPFIPNEGKTKNTEYYTQEGLTLTLEFSSKFGSLTNKVSFEVVKPPKPTSAAGARKPVKKLAKKISEAEIDSVHEISSPTQVRQHHQNSIHLNVEVESD